MSLVQRMNLQPPVLTGLPLSAEAEPLSPGRTWRLGPLLARLDWRLPRLELSVLLQSTPSVCVFRMLPPRASRWLLGLVGRAYFSLNRTKRARILASLEAFLGQDAGRRELRRLWGAVRGGIIDHYHEKLMLGFQPLERVQKILAERLEVEGEPALARAYAQGRGVVLVTGHFGAVEYLPLSLAMRGYPLTTMVHCKSEGLRRALEEKAARFGTNLLDPKSESVLFRAIQELKGGRVLITQCDELDCWRPYSNQVIDFLGLEAGLDRSLEILVRKSKAPVVFGLMHRRPGRRYRLCLQPVDPGPHPPRGQVARSCLSLLCQSIGQEPQAWYEWAKLNRLIDDPPVAPENPKPVGLPGEAAAQVSHPA